MKNKIKEFYPNVINFHFTDRCNYRCKYCFVDKQQNLEISFENAVKIVDNIDRYFKKHHIKEGRINLVGGEPLTYLKLNLLIDYIYSKGIKVSIVTNGYLLSKEFIQQNASKIAMIGISVDSLLHETNLRIGRCTAGNSTLSEEQLEERSSWILESGINLKINVCLSKYNLHEDLSGFLNRSKANRIKLLQMTIVEEVNSEVREMALSKDEFHDEISKYDNMGATIENFTEIENSYIMVNSSGNLIQKTLSRYQEVGCLLDSELDLLMGKASYDEEGYSKRYANL